MAVSRVCNKTWIGNRTQEAQKELWACFICASCVPFPICWAGPRLHGSKCQIGPGELQLLAGNFNVDGNRVAREDLPGCQKARQGQNQVTLDGPLQMPGAIFQISTF